MDIDRFDRIAGKVASGKMAGSWNWYCEMWMPAGGTYCQGYFTTTYSLNNNEYLIDFVKGLVDVDKDLKNVLGRVKWNHSNFETRVSVENGVHKIGAVMYFTLKGEGNEEMFQELVSKLIGTGVNVEVKRTSTKPSWM